MTNLTYRGYDLVELASGRVAIFDGDEEVDVAASVKEAQAVIDYWKDAR